jgi:hypothetical protein
VVLGSRSGTTITDSRSRVLFGLTRGGRQLVGSIRLKGCLSWILLWRSNKLLKWNGMRKTYS